MGDHFFDEFGEGGAGFPVELTAGFGGVAQRGVDFSRAEVAGVDFDHGAAGIVDSVLVEASSLPAEIDVEFGRGQLGKFADAVLLSGGNDVIAGVVRPVVVVDQRDCPCDLARSLSEYRPQKSISACISIS